MPWTEIDARSRGQFAIMLDRDHAAILAHDLGKHGRVIAGTGADLHHALTSLQIDVVEIACPEAWQAIVEAPRVIDSHKNVVVDPAKIIVGG